MGAHAIALGVQGAIEMGLNGKANILNSLAAIADKVIVIVRLKVIAAGAICWRDLQDQPLLGQQLEIAVHSGQADLGHLGLDFLIKIFSGGMRGVPLQGGKDRLPLPGDSWNIALCHVQHTAKILQSALGGVNRMGMKFG